jgi:hypothetical protein
MGNARNQPSNSDLFLDASSPEFASPSASSPSSSPVPDDRAAASARHVLPKDLSNAIKQLEDQELDRLLAAALAEHRRRGGRQRLAESPPRKLRVGAVGVSLTTGKLNAVRAAFKAGVKPSQIGRQFGLSQSEVRQALASDQKA